MKYKFNIQCIASGFSKDAIPYYKNKYAMFFEKAGGHFLDASLQNPDILCFYFIISGGTERMLLNSVNSHDNKRVFLIAHPENNSLPASLEMTAKLQQDNIPVKLFFLDNDNIEKSIASIQNEIINIETNQKLKYSNIGLIGEPSDWLIASSPKPKIITEMWGPNIKHISLENIYSEFSNYTLSDNGISKCNSFSNKAEKILEPTRKEIIDSVKIYEIIKSIVEENSLSALTIKCFDIVLKEKTTGCYALAQLNEEGIISGCEGDLVSTLAMLWCYYLTNELPWMANPSSFNISENTLNLAHCTIPFKLTDNYTVRSHFESNLGVAIEGIMPEKEVTLLRIGGKNLDKLWVAEGKIIKNTKFPIYCRTQVKVELKNNESLQQLINNPLGNHITLIYGHHADKLKSYFYDVVN